MVNIKPSATQILKGYSYLLTSRVGDENGPATENVEVAVIEWLSPFSHIGVPITAYKEDLDLVASTSAPLVRSLFIYLGPLPIDLLLVPFTPVSDKLMNP